MQEGWIHKTSFIKVGKTCPNHVHVDIFAHDDSLLKSFKVDYATIKRETLNGFTVTVEPHKGTAGITVHLQLESGDLYQWKSIIKDKYVSCRLTTAQQQSRYICRVGTLIYSYPSHMNGDDEDLAIEMVRHQDDVLAPVFSALVNRLKECDDPDLFLKWLNAYKRLSKLKSQTQ